MEDEIVVLIEDDETIIAEMAEQGPPGPPGDSLITDEQRAALAGTAGAPSDVNRFVTDEDARMSDTRTPTGHAASHSAGGEDALTPGDIGAAESGHDHDGTYAPAAKGVTGGDTHDHSDGDGAPILKTISIGVTVDGAGAVITAGSKGFRPLPAPATILGWRLVADQAGSVVMDVRKCSFAEFPASVSIVGGNNPALVDQQKSENSDLTEWDAALAAGDELEFVVVSAAAVTWVRLSLTISY